MGHFRHYQLRALEVSRRVNREFHVQQTAAPCVEAIARNCRMCGKLFVPDRGHEHHAFCTMICFKDYKATYALPRWEFAA